MFQPSATQGKAMQIVCGLFGVLKLSSKYKRLTYGGFRERFCFLSFRQTKRGPLFYLSMLLVILGVQFFLAGFLGELIDRNASDRNKYLIDKNI